MTSMLEPQVQKSLYTERLRGHPGIHISWLIWPDGRVICSFAPIGRRGDILTLGRDGPGLPEWACVGCFFGVLEQFELEVARVHWDIAKQERTEHGRAYKAALEYWDNLIAVPAGRRGESRTALHDPDAAPC